jgi:hypothetical protein
MIGSYWKASTYLGMAKISKHININEFTIAMDVCDSFLAQISFSDQSILFVEIFSHSLQLLEGVIGELLVVLQGFRTNRYQVLSNVFLFVEPPINVFLEKTIEVVGKVLY